MCMFMDCVGKPEYPEKTQGELKGLSHLPVNWLVDTVVSVRAEQQGPPTGHGASSRHPA